MNIILIIFLTITLKHSWNSMVSGISFRITLENECGERGKKTGQMYVGHLGFIILFWATFATSETFHNKKFIKETMKFFKT